MLLHDVTFRRAMLFVIVPSVVEKVTIKAEELDGEAKYSVSSASFSMNASVPGESFTP